MKLATVLPCAQCGANTNLEYQSQVLLFPKRQDAPGRILVMHEPCAVPYAPQAVYVASVEQFGEDVLDRKGLIEAVYRGNVTERQAREFLSFLYLDAKDEWLDDGGEVAEDLARRAVKEHDDRLDSIEGEKLPRRGGRVPEGAEDLRRS